MFGGECFGEDPKPTVRLCLSTYLRDHTEVFTSFYPDADKWQPNRRLYLCKLNGKTDFAYNYRQASIYSLVFRLMPLPYYSLALKQWGYTGFALSFRPIFVLVQ